MKELEETRTDKYYICETCNYKSTYQKYVEQCELKHICRHEQTEIQFTYDDDSNTFWEMCLACNENIKDSRIQDAFSRCVSQPVLRTIYEMVKEQHLNAALLKAEAKQVQGKK